MNYFHIEIDLPFIFGGLESYLLVDLICKYKYYESKNELILINTKNCFFYTYESIQKRLPFSRCQLDTIIKNLKSKNVIEIYKKGLPARNHFYINFEVFNSLRESYKLECKKLTNYNVETLQTSELSNLQTENIENEFENENLTEKTSNLDNSSSLLESYKVENLQTSLQHNNKVETLQTITQKTDNNIINNLLIKYNIDIEEKNIFSNSPLSNFDTFEKVFSINFEFDNIENKFYLIYNHFNNNEITIENNITEWIDYLSNKFREKKLDLLVINDIDTKDIIDIVFSEVENIILEEPKKEILEEPKKQVESKKEKKEKPTKEKTSLHPFEKSIYFENYELFKKDFEEKYIDIDSEFYFEKYSNQSIAKAYKYTDWKRVFINWLNDLKGNYQKIQIQSITETPKHGYENLTFEQFNKFDKKQMITFLTTCKDAPKIIQKLNPELFCFFIFEPYINFVLSIRFERMYDGEIEKEMKKINPENEKWVNYNCIQFNEPLKEHIEKIKRAKKYEPYNGEYENVYPELTV